MTAKKAQPRDNGRFASKNVSAAVERQQNSGNLVSKRGYSAEPGPERAMTQLEIRTNGIANNLEALERTVARLEESLLPITGSVNYPPGAPNEDTTGIPLLDTMDLTIQRLQVLTTTIEVIRNHLPTV